MSLTKKLSLARNNYSRPSLVSDIPPGDGKIANLFYSVEERKIHGLKAKSRRERNESLTNRIEEEKRGRK
jgi:hypothetical protein